MDLRKWIAQDGFDTDFLLQHAEDADETTVSAVTESSQSAPSEAMSPTPHMEEQSKSVPMITQEPPSTSTPLPSDTVDKECMSAILDGLREVNIVVDDLKADKEALESKILLQRLELDELRVSKKASEA